MIQQETGELDALVSLLDDDNERVQEAVSARLRKLGRRAIPTLERGAESPNDQARGRAGQLIEVIRRDAVVESFSSLAQAPEFDLESGAFLLARTRDPLLDEDTARARLDALGAQVREEVPPGLSATETVERFSEILFRRNGFRGNQDDYYSPDNSYLDRVLETGLGNPIGLSAIAMFVGDRAGLPLSGIGLPGHFLMAYGEGDGRILFDPFFGGATISEEQCRSRVTEAEIPWRDDHLAPLPPRMVMFRMIVNLLLIYQTAGAQGQIDALGRLATAIQQSPPPDMRASGE